MSLAGTTWRGLIPIKNKEFEFEIGFSYNLDDIRISFPQCGQFFIEPEEYSFYNDYVFVVCIHMGEYYKLILQKKTADAIKGLIFGDLSIPNSFLLFYKDEYNIQKSVYQPWPRKEKLINKLSNSSQIDYSKLETIKYPELNNIYYEVLRDRYNFNNFFPFEKGVDRAILMTKYINKLVPQKGMVVLPTQRDGITLLEYVLKNGGSLNCRGCSLILTDCLMSIGILARTVHCMSEDIFDPESHYLTEMLDSENDRWVIMDAAFGCFFESNGELLGVKEIRENLEKRIPICIKSSKKTFVERFKQKIEYNLIKNFYRFEYYSNYEPGYANLFLQTKKILIEPNNEENNL